MTMNIQLERARVLAVSRVDVNRSVGPSLRHRSWLAVRHAIICSLSIGLIAGVLGGAWASPSFAATTSKDKSLFVTVASSYNAAVTEFNVVIDSFPACSSPTCVSDAIEGAGDTSFYKATLALEKKGRIPPASRRTSLSTWALSSTSRRTSMPSRRPRRSLNRSSWCRPSSRSTSRTWRSGDADPYLPGRAKELLNRDAPHGSRCARRVRARVRSFADQRYLRTKIFRALSSCGENGRFFVYCVPVRLESTLST